jgi:hypothetical protein
VWAVHREGTTIEEKVSSRALQTELAFFARDLGSFRVAMAGGLLAALDLQQRGAAADRVLI